MHQIIEDLLPSQQGLIDAIWAAPILALTFWIIKRIIARILMPARERFLKRSATQLVLLDKQLKQYSLLSSTERVEYRMALNAHINRVSGGDWKSTILAFVAVYLAFTSISVFIQILWLIVGLASFVRSIYLGIDVRNKRELLAKIDKISMSLIVGSTNQLNEEQT